MKTKYSETVKKIKYKSYLILIVPLVLFITSCKKFVEAGTPKNEITNEAVFTTDASATSAIRGVYSLMMANKSFSNGELERYTGLLADELTNYSSDAEQQQFFFASLTPNNNIVYGAFWKQSYLYVNNVNTILEGLQQTGTLSEAVKKQLTGEALFIRAFCHFYLVNLFGDIPYITSTDYKVNAIALRIPVAEVYKKITEDLLQAQLLMTEGFSFSNNERIQANKGAATALLARVYLFTSEWTKAEAQASSLLSNTATYSLETDLTKVFLANSKETIWQLKPVIPGTNTTQAQYFILTNEPQNLWGVALSNEMYTAFEAGDERKVKWTSSFSNSSGTWNYAFKYKVSLASSITEYATVFRLAEQYLIRAEARAQQDKVTAAQNDVNVIRNRASLGNTTANDKASLLAAIAQERKAELFCEWGHRWLDLKRNNQATTVLGPLKPNWQSTDVLFPIPQPERLVNPKLTQNPGF